MRPAPRFPALRTSCDQLRHLRPGRLETQVAACGLNVTILATNGSSSGTALGLLVPLVVLLASSVLMGLLGP